MTNTGHKYAWNITHMYQNNREIKKPLWETLERTRDVARTFYATTALPNFIQFSYRNTFPLTCNDWILWENFQCNFPRPVSTMNSKFSGNICKNPGSVTSLRSKWFTSAHAQTKHPIRIVNVLIHNPRSNRMPRQHIQGVEIV